MSTKERLEDAIQGLQQLGLQEYEARCFVGLSRLSSGTAKQISEITEVPRTRVYDAIRVLETKGLVEVHHSSPKQFRAVPLEEAMETLRDQYESRVSRVQRALESVDSVDTDDESPVQEVWSISGADPIEHRTVDLVDQATEEVVLLLADRELLTGGLVAALNEVDDDTELLVGAASDSLRSELQEAVDPTGTFTSELEWLTAGDSPTMGHVLLADRSTLLVSTVLETNGMHAVYGSGVANGMVHMVGLFVSEQLLPRIRDKGI